MVLISTSFVVQLAFVVVTSISICMVGFILQAAYSSSAIPVSNVLPQQLRHHGAPVTRDSTVPTASLPQKFVAKHPAQTLSGFANKIYEDSSRNVTKPDKVTLWNEKHQIDTDALLSRSSNVSVTCDCRGNLGPCSVVVQDPPGVDWIKDRWQAASDMGGTAIKGTHWVVLDFHETVTASRVVLDWETAYAEDYRLEGSMKATLPNGSKQTAPTLVRNATSANTGNSIDSTTSGDEDWEVIWSSNYKNDTNRRRSTSYGQSPGVNYKLPLHVIHTIELNSSTSAAYRTPFRSLRLFILKPARGWGVSLWQFDVYGSRSNYLGS